jgi:hypothetical protein
MKEQRFKIGDKVTYKNKNDCPDNRYCSGGENMRDAYLLVLRLKHDDHMG